MPVGQVVYEGGATPSHLVFPTTSVVSLQNNMKGGLSAEIAMVGNEGLLGMALFMGGGSTPGRAVVQAGGQAYRLPAVIWMQEFNRSGHLMRLALRYTQALIAHMAQTAACNQHHTVDQRLCRWLLLTLDRLPARELVMTQEHMGHTLGVCRSGVIEAAGTLQRLGLIRYARGHVRVLDRAGLERRVCDCYGVVKAEYDRLLPVRPAVRRKVVRALLA